MKIKFKNAPPKKQLTFNDLSVGDCFVTNSDKSYSNVYVKLEKHHGIVAMNLSLNRLSGLNPDVYVKLVKTELIVDFGDVVECDDVVEKTFKDLSDGDFFTTPDYKDQVLVKFNDTRKGTNAQVYGQYTKEYFEDSTIVYLLEK